MTPTPHDALFKATYSDPARAAAHLASALPKDIVEKLDLGSLVVLPGSYIDPALAQSASDLLYEVRLRAGGLALIYVLFEHQSSPDERMALRLFFYIARIWERWISENPKANHLPVVLPLVLYHGERPWTVSPDLSALFGLPRETEDALTGLGVNLRYLLRDLSERSDEELKETARDAMDLLVQLLLKHGRDEDLFEQLGRWVEVWRAVAAGPGLRALQLVLSYIAHVQGPRGKDQLRPFLVKALGTTGQEAYMSWTSEIEARGEARGKREIFLSLLQQRFGPLTPDVLTRVNDASVDELTAWTERFFRAASAEELVGLAI